MDKTLIVGNKKLAIEHERMPDRTEIDWETLK